MSPRLLPVRVRLVAGALAACVTAMLPPPAVHAAETGGPPVLLATATQEPPALEATPGEEIVSRRSANSRTFATATPDKFKTQLFSRPVHYRTGGKWARIDPRLVRDDDGTFTNNADEVNVDIARSAGGELGRVELGEGRAVGFSLAHARDVAGDATSARVTFEQVRPGVDLALSAVPGGIKEEIVLESAASLRVFDFPLRLDGLTASLTPTGSVALDDEEGQTQAVIPHGWMVDASEIRNVSTGVQYQLLRSGGESTLRVTVDDAWLDDADRVWPVTVDPTIVLAKGTTNNGDAWVNQAAPTTSYGADTSLAIGATSGGVRRALAKFAGIDDFAGRTISHADLVLYNWSSATCTAKGSRVRRNYPVDNGTPGDTTDDNSWNVNKVNWNNRPATAAISGASANVSHGNEPGCANAKIYYPMTQAVRNWSGSVGATAVWENNGITILASEGDTTSSGGTRLINKTFSSSEAATNSQWRWPQFEVTWSDTPPDAPISPSPADGATTTQLAPDLKAGYSDRDNPGAGGQLHFQILKNDVVEQEGHVAGLANGQVAQWQPTANLVSEQQYTWKVRAYDGVTWVPATWDAAPARALTPDNTGPQVSITAPDDQWRASQNVTMSWAATDGSGVATYNWAVNTSPTYEPSLDVDTHDTSTSATSQLADGVHYLHVRAKDTNGTWGPVAHQRIAVDTTPPALAITSQTHPSESSTYTATTFAAEWTSTAPELAPITGYSVVLDQAPTTQPPTDGTTQTEASYSAELAIGTSWLHVRGRDAAGNWGDTDHYKVQINDPSTLNSEVFSFTGAAQTWVVPEGVTSIRVEAYGAQGGGDHGGLGGSVHTDLSVVPGESLEIRVGGQGSVAGAGWNGGGSAVAPATGGGGASDIRRPSYSLSARAVVAGGGGGAAASANTATGMGGAGGGLSGGPGGQANWYPGLEPSAGATQTSGWQLGAGQNGTCNFGCAGGGGGGYWGGLQGQLYANATIKGGGSGGSGFASPTVSTNTTMSNGVQRGDGQIRLVYPIDSSEPAAPDPGTQTFGYTGAPQYWTVPAGLHAVDVEAWGAQGGGGKGGLGGLVKATVSVTPGQVVQVTVGGQGTSQVGGFNGGGRGLGGAGGGGGSTDLRIAGITPRERIVVAGAGGGEAAGATTLYGAGGAGGGLSGGRGERHSYIGLNETAEPGTQTDGWFSAMGQDGSCDGACAGGGGAGFYGGRSGPTYAHAAIKGGGGGGSGHVAESSGVATQMLDGVRLGDGLVKLTWPPRTPEVPAEVKGSTQFEHTGDAQFWTVPAGVESIRVETYGAQGGGALGALGGHATADLPVVGGQVALIHVGGAGGSGQAGWNGGGGAPAGSGGGGGGSDVRLGGRTQADRHVVAGGGGGAAAGADGVYGFGGIGGGVSGGDGGAGSHWVTKQAAGATQMSGYTTGLGESGYCWDACNGGGGGGYWGGLQGDSYLSSAIQGGGSGGSGFVSPASFGGLLASGGRTGHGMVKITWPAPLDVEQAFGGDPYGDMVEGVQVGSGNLVEQATDFDVATAGPDLTLERTYNSLDTREGIFGKGWSSSYEMSATETLDHVTILYANGRRERYQKNADGTFTAPKGYVSTLSRPSGGGWSLQNKDKTVHTFDSAGRLTDIADAYGRTLALSYEGSDLTEVKDVASGRALRLTYSAGRVTSVSTTPVTVGGSASPLTWRYSYDTGRLVAACEPRNNDTTSGWCTRYDYTDGRLTQITRPHGNVAKKVSYRGDSRVDWVDNGVGKRTTFTYGGGMTRVVSPEATTRSFFFDYSLRTKRITYDDGASVTYEYDAKGFRSSTRDENGHRTVMDYDSRGNLLTSTNAAGDRSHWKYDGDALVAKLDARSASRDDTTYATTYTNNPQGDVLTETLPATSEHSPGPTTTYSYTTGGGDHGWGPVPAGLLRKATRPRGVTTHDYDSNGDLRRVTAPSGLITEYQYDELGRRTTVTEDWASGRAVTTTAYDRAGNVVRTEEPRTTNAVTTHDHQRVTTLDYDANGRVVEQTVSDGISSPEQTTARTTTFAYDDADRLRLTTHPTGGGTTSRSFDDNGNVATVTDPEGRTFRTVYDTLDRPVETRLEGFVDDPIQASAPRDVVIEQRRYDAAGRLTVLLEPQPGTGGRDGQLPPETPMRETWTTYDRAGRVVSVTRRNVDQREGAPSAYRDITLQAYTYDAAGNRTSEVTGGALRDVRHTYDAAGRLQQSRLKIAGADRVQKYNYDANGNVVAHSIHAGDTAEPVAQTRMTYNDADVPIAETVENGVDDLVTTHEVDARGLRVSTTDPRGNTTGATATDFQTDFRYDDAGRLIRTIAPAVTVEDPGSSPTSMRPTTRFGYDAIGNRTHEQEPRGATTVTSYDLLDRRTRIDHPTYTAPGPVAVTAHESFTYDKVGNLVSRRDRRGHDTDYLFDARNRVVRQLDPAVGGQARGATLFAYDDMGNQERITDPTGAVVTSTHDDLGRVRTSTTHVRQSPVEGQYSTLFDHDDLGNKIFERDPTGVITSWEYNAAGETTKTIDAEGHATTNQYDAAGRLTSTVDPLGRAVHQVHDMAGRRTATEQRDGVDGPLLATTWFNHDPAGNVTARRSPRSTSSTDDTYRTTLRYDAANRVVQITEPATATSTITTAYGYDANANLTRFTDGRSEPAVTRYGWTAWNQLESVSEPATPGQNTDSERTFTTVYDAAGLPIEEHQPGGVTIARTFDALGRLKVEAGTGAPVTGATRTFDYDAAGRPTSLNHPDGTITAAYDDRGLLLSTTTPGSTQLASAFRYDGAGRLTGRDDAAGTSTFGYDTRGLLASGTDPLTSQTTSFTHNPAGQVETASYGGASGAQRTYSYDNRGRLASDRLEKDTSTVHATSYDYDAEGNVVKQAITAPGNDGAGEHTYAYDPIGRLTGWTAPNNVTTEYAYDAAGNRIKAGTDEFTFDARNRVTAGPDGTAYTWTPRGTLDSTAVTVDGATTVTDVDFDALGRQRMHGQTTYTFDALDRVATRDAQPFTYAGFDIDPTAVPGHKVARTPHGDLLAVDAGDGGRFAGENRHGDLAWLATPAGVLDASRVYQPDGQVAGAAGAQGLAFGYQADYTDPTTSQVWMGARWYDPTLAAFTSRDTVFGQLQTPVSLNRYTYANGDPMEYFDPDGRFSFSLGGLFDRVKDTIGKVVSTVTGGVKKAVAIGRQAVAKATDIGSRAVRTAARQIAHAGSSVRSAAATGVRIAGRAVGTCARSRTCRGAVVAGAFNSAKDVGGEVLQQVAGRMTSQIHMQMEAGASVAEMLRAAKSCAGDFAGCRENLQGFAGSVRRDPAHAAHSAIRELTYGPIADDVKAGNLGRAYGRAEFDVSAIMFTGGAGKLSNLGRLRRVAPDTAGGGGLVQGANGALRNPATGRFAPNPVRVASEPRSGIHGNSRLSQEPTSLYRLYDFEGNYLKTGITSNPAGRYTQDFMSDKFMDIINVGSRSNMMDLERRIVELDPGPLNLERWAGAAR